MIGVVIWSDDSSEKAVIWCEDQGALAFLDGADNLTVPAKWPAAGDLMDFECEDAEGLRRASSATVVATGACPSLPEALLGQTNRPASHLRLVAGTAIDGTSPRAADNDAGAEVKLGAAMSSGRR